MFWVYDFFSSNLKTGVPCVKVKCRVRLMGNLIAAKVMYLKLSAVSNVAPAESHSLLCRYYYYQLQSGIANPANSWSHQAPIPIPISDNDHKRAAQSDKCPWEWDRRGEQSTSFLSFTVTQSTALHPLPKSQAHLWRISCSTNPLVILPRCREVHPTPWTRGFRRPLAFWS